MNKELKNNYKIIFEYIDNLIKKYLVSNMFLNGDYYKRKNYSLLQREKVMTKIKLKTSSCFMRDLQNTC